MKSIDVEELKKIELDILVYIDVLCKKINLDIFYVAVLFLVQFDIRDLSHGMMI